MRQEEAVQDITASLKKDPAVRSIFLKGSMGRNDHDAYSDIDLYCMVEEKEEQAFLKRRIDHLKAYKELIFTDDIFIIAPQIIGVYEDHLHIDLFTVTEATFQNKDYFTVLYDPDGIMDPFRTEGKLTLTKTALTEHMLDVSWFLFQYWKAAARGSAVWAVEMLRHVMRNLANVLLYKYEPDRSVLGLKALPTHLPEDKRFRIEAIYEWMTPSLHRKAAREILLLLKEEGDWIRHVFSEEEKAVVFMESVVVLLSEEPGIERDGELPIIRGNR